MTRRLFSFDLDGTLSFGNPSGIIQPAHLKRLKEQGYFIGSASGKLPEEQTELWVQHGIPPDFVIKKDLFDEWRKIKDRFNAEQYMHIGDSEDDERVAKAEEYVKTHSADAISKQFITLFNMLD